jgi:NAD(P)-dependent dehydrogenase (short-subunit alcohol dehydrogenase family)
VEPRRAPIQPGNVAVITGGASGIGRALAHAFAARGMHIVLADIDEQRMRTVEVELAEAGSQVLPVVCDTSTEPSVQALAEATMSHFGAAHVLCNNAGVVGKGDPWRGPISTWEWVLGINLYGVIHGVRAFLPIMEDQGCGHIVNTASMAGLLAMPGSAPYAVSKAGVVSLTEGLFVELKARASAVSTSVLCPGFVKTNLMDGQQWTARLGDEPAATADPLGVMMESMLRDGVQAGIDATDVAAQVVDAIDADRMWVLTHADMAPLAVQRMERAVAQENPA